MKTLFLCISLILGTSVLALAEETALEVAPSETIKYPDASQILNKTDAPTPAKPLPAAGPLLGAKPLPAAPTVKKPLPAPTGQWYLKWNLKGQEADVLEWAQKLNRSASVHQAGDGLWEVWAGPLDPGALPEALDGQAGIATLVKR